jgi:hypothetical protein
MRDDVRALQCPQGQPGTGAVVPPNILDRGEVFSDNCHGWNVRRRNNSISDALRKAIKDSGLTYTELEKATGVKRASIMRFIRGERTLRLDMADRLALYFGIKVEYLGERRANDD